MKQIELLAPAGSVKGLHGVLEAGADAVYIGGAKFGARAYADNPDPGALLEAIDYVHSKGKKLYLTVNTLLKNKEIEEELYEYLVPYYQQGLDAVIVQDLGVFSFIKRNFPGMHLHASTQMTLTGPKGAKFLQEQGADRIVTARELTLQDIAAIREETSLEIESFVHGALCVCYSGQCLMSSLFGGRSGNRGRCAQPCRLPYEVYAGSQKLTDKNHNYVLSPKDMCTVQLLPEIIKAGVTSLKIEGRMKKPEYAAGIVEIYRKYLDLALSGKRPYKVEAQDYEQLLDLYNRDGFHTGYYKGKKGPFMMAMKNEKQTGEQKLRNEALFSRIRDAYVDKNSQLPLVGTLYLEPDQPATLQAGDCIVTGDLVQKAQKAPLTKERVLAQMNKTGDSDYYWEDLQIYMSDDCFMPMQALNQLRRQLMEQLKEQKLSGYKRSIAIEKPLDGQTVERRENTHTFSYSTLVSTKEQLKVCLESQHISRIYLSLTALKREEYEEVVTTFIKKAKVANKEAYLAFPYVTTFQSFTEQEQSYFKQWITQGLDGYLVRNMELLAMLKEQSLLTKVILDANMYTWNQESLNFWRQQGVCNFTAPVELNKKELSSRNNTQSESIVYGYLPLMVTAQCLKKNLSNCSKNSEVLTLQDRYNKNFCVKCECDFCYNIIYNSVPLYLLDQISQLEQMHMAGVRLQFTQESAKETQKILAQLGEKDKLTETNQTTQNQFTKGHYKRGVQ